MKPLPLLLLVLSTPAVADPAGPGHMMDWGYGHGYGMILGPLVWLVFIAAIVAVCVWFLRSIDGQRPQKGPSAALAELDMRFARGEIDAAEYSERKKLLSD